MFRRLRYQGLRVTFLDNRSDFKSVYGKDWLATGDTGITGMKRGAIIAHCLSPALPVSPVVNQSLPDTDSKSYLLFKRVNCDLWYLRRLNKTCGFA